MELEISFLTVSLLVIAGLIGGFINTLAGGGSMLTLPVLMMMGMPADVANATNRVGVFLQSATAARGFKNYDRLDSGAILPMLVPTVLGALAGSLLASFLPVWLLKPTLLAAMVAMAIYMIVKPEGVTAPEGSKAYGVFEKPAGFIALFFAGVYGGFVQAGVGFILIAALAGSLRYDLVRANALKVA
ncbi:MAG: sulfite exporter TauE/SafE family protein, partial [Pseudomonadales bacterium]